MNIPYLFKILITCPCTTFSPKWAWAKIYKAKVASQRIDDVIGAFCPTTISSSLAAQIESSSTGGIFSYTLFQISILIDPD